MCVFTAHIVFIFYSRICLPSRNSHRKLTCLRAVFDRSQRVNLAEINTLEHIMTEENYAFKSISAFDSAHVKYGI